MLPLKLQNRIDLLFAAAIRKNPDCANQPFVVADSIFEQIQPASGSLYLKDVQDRCKILALRNSCESLYTSSLGKAGRPKKWVLKTSLLRVPVEYHDALREIALEWQEQYQKSLPF